jgi:hypothetical protein
VEVEERGMRKRKGKNKGRKTKYEKGNKKMA